jgi:hypothetical protein
VDSTYSEAQFEVRWNGKVEPEMRFRRSERAAHLFVASIPKKFRQQLRNHSVDVELMNGWSERGNMAMKRCMLKSMAVRVIEARCSAGAQLTRVGEFLECTTCEATKYGLAGRKCHDCEVGGRCAGGSKIKAQPGFW